MIKVGFCQFNPKFGEKEKNLYQVEKLLEKIEAELIVLPELFNTGYVFSSRREVEKLAEKIPQGATTSFLIHLAKRKKCFLVAGLAEKTRQRIYNSAVLVGPSGYLGTYRKHHLFFKEKKWFSRGQEPLRIYNLKWGKIGIMICFDWIFPEVARTLSLKGAEIICHPANLILPYCQNAMITRSIENRVFTITANRIGEERGWRFTGESQITTPDGKILARAGKKQEIVRVIAINPKEARNKKITPLNDLFGDR